MTWLFDDKPFIESNIKNYYGFVYQITNLVTGQLYIGRKYFYTKRKPAITKKNKGKRRTRVTAYSDWNNYWGSCQELLDDIKKYGEDKFKREIIVLCTTPGDINYCENEELFGRNVLDAKLPNGEREFYNNNIMSRYFSLPKINERKYSVKFRRV